MILSIFVYKSRFSCPFFYIKPPSADVFHKQKSIVQCIFVYFCPLIQLEKAPNINKKQSKQVFLFIIMWLRAGQETREGAQGLKMSERGLLHCWNKYDFGSRALLRALFRCSFPIFGFSFSGFFVISWKVNADRLILARRRSYGKLPDADRLGQRLTGRRLRRPITAYFKQNCAAYLFLFNSCAFSTYCIPGKLDKIRNLSIFILLGRLLWPGRCMSQRPRVPWKLSDAP